MKTLISSVRPIVTYTFVVGQIALAAAWAAGLPKAEPAFAALSADRKSTRLNSSHT